MKQRVRHRCAEPHPHGPPRCTVFRKGQNTCQKVAEAAPDTAAAAADHYVEHFAVCPGMRNRGYGRKVLGMLRSRLRTPVVLEVERPDSELAARRIAFYRRNGFTLWESDYVQPPYRPGGDAVPMRLMVCGALCEADDFASVKETIHREVYGCPPATRG